MKSYNKTDFFHSWTQRTCGDIVGILDSGVHREARRRQAAAAALRSAAAPETD